MSEDVSGTNPMVTPENGTMGTSEIQVMALSSYFPGISYFRGAFKA
jgi:hypothetical protein